jgi:hypothetical protein
VDLQQQIQLANDVAMRARDVLDPTNVSGQIKEFIPFELPASRAYGSLAEK